jgi:hypothetical protein
MVENIEFEMLSYDKSQNYFLIDTDEQANKILNEIINDKGCIIGIDIEAAVEMSRFGILCLLQVKIFFNIYKYRFVIRIKFSFLI